MNDSSFIIGAPMNPKVVDKEERRNEILAAAKRIFARKGYSATRIGDVAGEAGIANGTVYLYFSSREEILVAAFEEFEERLLARVHGILEGEGPALEKLRSGVRAVLGGLGADPDLSRVALDFWSAGAFEDGGPRIDFGRVYGRYRKVIGGLLEEGKREGSVRQDLPEDTPAVIVGAIEGVLLQWIVDPEAVCMEEMGEPILDVILGGLKRGKVV